MGRWEGVEGIGRCRRVVRAWEGVGRCECGRVVRVWEGVGRCDSVGGWGGCGMGEGAEKASVEVLYDTEQATHVGCVVIVLSLCTAYSSRWHSMEMAGIVCYTGANIITRAREIVEQVG